MNITVTLPSGEKQNQSFSVKEVTIGRGQKADFIIMDESLSRLHAKIEVINHEFFVTDLGSSNGVFLDSTRIPANQRTPFSTFFVLHLGPLECQVTEISDSEPISYGQNKAYKSEGIDELNKVTKTSRSINRVAMNSPLPSIKKAPEAKSQFPLIVLLVMAMMGAVVYFQFSSENEQASVAPLEATPPPAPVAAPIEVPPQEVAKVVKNDFLTLNEYEAIGLKKSCKQHFDICHTMELTEDESEGILIDEKEAFIFMSPLRKVKNFASLADKPDAMDLIALSTFISSSPYTSLLNKELEQVHILIQNDQFKISKVFRFNANDYKSSDAITTGITDALFTGKSETFWQALNSQVKSKTF